MVLNVLACHPWTKAFWCSHRTEQRPKPWRHSSLTPECLLGGATQVARGGKSGTRQSRRWEERTRPRTRKALACDEGGRLDGPTKRQGKTRCTGPVGTKAPRLVTGGRHPEKRRARWSLLRGPLRPDEAGIIYTMSGRRGSILSRGRSPPPEGGVDGLENVFTARVRSHGSDRGGTNLTEQLTTGALLLVIGAVLTIIGIVFFQFLCIDVRLVVVYLILIVAEGGRVTKPPFPPYPGYGPSPPYAPYAAMPPAAGPPRPSDAEPASPTSPPTRYCVNCGSALTAGAAFCAQCGAPVQR